MNARGKNFTEKEKCKLLELVQKYKHIVENKCTNTESTVKKNHAWETITDEFNTTSEVLRTQKQLNTAYLNLKRCSRSNTANDHIKKFLQKIQNSVGNECDDNAGTSEDITLHDEKDDSSTGGDVYQPVLTINGEALSKVMGEQETPLSNSCDSASSFYKSHDVVTSLPLQVVLQPPDSQDHNYTPTVSKSYSTSASVKARHKKDVLQNGKTNAENNELLKKQYYHRKLECAVIEKKTKLLEYKMSIRKYKLLDLEIKIKQKEYENLIKKK